MSSNHADCIKTVYLVTAKCRGRVRGCHASVCAGSSLLERPEITGTVEITLEVADLSSAILGQEGDDARSRLNQG